MKKICEYEKCRKEFETADCRKRFCDMSCAASYRNKGVRRHGKKPGKCLNCEKQLFYSARKYCSSKCQWDYAYKQWVSKWLSGNHNGLQPGKWYHLTYPLKRWLFENKGKKCEICLNFEWMGKEIPLLVDHIDGNAGNNSPENLRLVCGNCNMQLPTFAGRNKGKGRKSLGLVRG